MEKGKGGLRGWKIRPHRSFADRPAEREKKQVMHPFSQGGEHLFGRVDGMDGYCARLPRIGLSRRAE
ncbi:hypothetical protein I3215_02000 [Streptomyces sp. RB110-1]|uniref:hypothetical protein n=1 Tax=Streptomyces sp. RB110-2 TaxID=2794863 RepID=UPI0018FF7758|nr:hypothetical protein [Streptomyces sp. RB110-2]MBK0371689.1 hypothetical protein [Streptomyces sp. RB110-1]